MLKQLKQKHFYTWGQALQQLPSNWVVALFLLCLAATWQLGRAHLDPDIDAIPRIYGSSKACEVLGSKNPESFTIYAGGESIANALSLAFCEDAVVSRQFGSVTTHWVVNDETTLELIGKGRADLAQVKETFMIALGAESTHGYTKIAEYPSYKAFFIALKEKPRLNKEYLLDKTIGLVDYPTSRSAYIIPRQVLSRLGLSLDKMNIVYATSHGELRDMLAAGQVDMISSYWQEEDTLRFSENYITEISDSISGVAWYLKLNGDNPDLRCAAQHTLLEITQHYETQYYKQLELVNADDC